MGGMSSLAVRPFLRIATLLPALLLTVLAAVPVRGESGRAVRLEPDATRVTVEDRAVALPAAAAGAALPGATATAVSEPGGALAGLASLAGPGHRSLAVLWTPWEGEGWGAVETVSPAGPGSQLALSATSLDDGTPLLVWSRFGGGDDEIVWSRRDAAGWSLPARLAADNRVPDVTPTVAAVPGGALAAWSRFERATGQYHLLVSRFDGTAWSPPRELAGAGSLYPSFENDGVRPLLLYRSAAPRGWVVLEVDGEGVPARRAAVATAPVAVPERPTVRDGALRWADGRVELRWEETR